MLRSYFFIGQGFRGCERIPLGTVSYQDTGSTAAKELAVETALYQGMASAVLKASFFTRALAPTALRFAKYVKQ